ncbi:MAG TPA: P-loop NTPase [Firmicutes bacterium]|nr:P-loop NTPase [Candidatus Fermentithermobacillaceae bacterium]
MKEGPSLLIAGSAACEQAAVAKWPGANIVGSFRDLALIEFILSSVPVDIVAVESGLPTKGESFQDWVARFKNAFPKVSLVILDQGWELAEKDSSSAVPESPNVLTPQTIVVWSPKGGVGKTFLATNLSCAAALSTGGKAGLLDFDLYSGDVAVHLDLFEGPTITELVPVLADTRPEGLDKFCLRHGPSGLSVMCSPRRPELSDLVTPEHVRGILSLAARRWGLLYVDTPPDITSDVVGECIDAATNVVVVVTQDVAAIKQVKLAVDILRRLGIKEERLNVVLNRASKDSLMPQAKIQEFLGVELIGSIPDDRKAVERSVFEGKPVVLYSKSEISEALWQVASRLSPGLVRDKGQKKPEKRRGGLFW